MPSRSRNAFHASSLFATSSSTCIDLQAPRAMLDRGRGAARDPRDDDTRMAEHVHADAVERGERLGLVTEIVDEDPAVGQHAVDVAGRAARRARRRIGGRHAGPQALRSVRAIERQRLIQHARPEEVVQVQRADRALVRIDHEELRDLGRASPSVSTQSTASAVRAHGARRAWSSRRQPARRRCRARASTGAAQVAVGEDAGDAPVAVHDRPSCPCPCGSSRRWPRPASPQRASWAVASPPRMTSATRSRRRPSAPRTDASAESPAAENPRASSSASASASPSASVAVVLAVGARPSGHASASTAASRCTSPPARAALCSLPVIAMIRGAGALDVRQQRDELRRSRPNSTA